MPRGPTPRALAVGRGPWAVAGGVLRRAPRRALALSAQHRSTAARLPILHRGLTVGARRGLRESALASVAGNMCLPCVSVCLFLFMCVG